MARTGVIAACGAIAFGWMGPVDASHQSSAGQCRISGRAVSGAVALPGVSMVVRAGDVVKTATSTAPDGSYHLEVPAGAYVLMVELTGFTRIARPVAIGAAPCDQTIDFQLALEPRVAASANPTTTAVIRDGSPARFETLSVQTQAAAAASVDPATWTRVRRACCSPRVLQ